MLRDLHVVPFRFGFATLLAAILVAAGMLFPYSAASELGDPRPLCEECRRFWDKSESRTVFALRFKRIERTYQVCSLFCYCEFMEDYPGKEPERVQVVNHATLGAEFVQQLNAAKAHYLFDADGDEANNPPPHVYAFLTKEQAEEHQDELGGELMGWEEVHAKLTELASEFEPEPPRKYERQRIR